MYIQQIISKFHEAFGKVLGQDAAAHEAAVHLESSLDQMLALKLKAKLIITKIEFLIVTRARIVAEAYGQGDTDYETCRGSKEHLFTEGHEVCKEGIQIARIAQQVS